MMTTKRDETSKFKLGSIETIKNELRELVDLIKKYKVEKYSVPIKTKRKSNNVKRHQKKVKK